MYNNHPMQISTSFDMRKYEVGRCCCTRNHKARAKVRATYLQAGGECLKYSPLETHKPAGPTNWVCLTHSRLEVDPLPLIPNRDVVVSGHLYSSPYANSSGCMYRVNKSAPLITCRNSRVIRGYEKLIGAMENLIP